ncbi:sel1 repeat family protein [Azospira inquinata]|uniref:Sel1 repeat family protein n=1 Tax=Azospira inquinata TaxID=2785627 RepID=A0A975XUL5_9RHOO|nr:tetratricopeptide repeat protein [Azospira inquinata]QWT45793.1 sel1 repeat family protein [Azospira inquinata]QWT48885.1 sel1 repeat family protein [Azospira inquinata]
MSDLPEISVPQDGKSWAQVKARLSFTCAYEKDRIPPRDPEADQLYRYARWLRKKNLLTENPAQYPQMERLLRIATAYGHDKANLELRSLLGEGNATSDNREEEIYQLTQDLIRRGIPGGYYDMARMLEQGYGVKEDEELALKYYRKAADLGNPEAQYVVGDKISGVGNPPDIQAIGYAMFRCAAEQGHGEAALEYAIHQKILKHYEEALKIFQLGAKAGNEVAPSFLEHGFTGPASNDELHYLGQTKRSRTGKAISHHCGHALRLLLPETSGPRNRPDRSPAPRQAASLERQAGVAGSLGSQPAPAPPQ